MTLADTTLKRGPWARRVEYLASYPEEAGKAEIERMARELMAIAQWLKDEEFVSDGDG